MIGLLFLNDQFPDGCISVFICEMQDVNATIDICDIYAAFSRKTNFFQNFCSEKGIDIDRQRIIFITANEDFV